MDHKTNTTPSHSIDNEKLHGSLNDNTSMTQRPTYMVMNMIIFCKDNIKYVINDAIKISGLCLDHMNINQLI